MNEVTDNSGDDTTTTSNQSTVDTSVDTDADTSDQLDNASESTDEQATQSDDETKSEVASPFAQGKEKFVVDGKEYDWDWETTKKYAQIGKSGYNKMQEAAALKKQVSENYKKLVTLAQSNPQGLIEILTGQKASPGHAQGEQQAQQSEGATDWRDNEIRDLRSRIESRELAEERRAIETELQGAVSKYPVLNDEIATEYVKAQYAKALKQGMDVTIEDVAFHVAQKLQDKQTQTLKQKQQKIQQRRSGSTLTAPQGHISDSPKDMSMDDVKRLAGRA